MGKNILKIKKEKQKEVGSGEEEHCYCLARILCYSLGSSQATEVNSTAHERVGRIILLSVCKTTRHFWMEKSSTSKAIFHSTLTVSSLSQHSE